MNARSTVEISALLGTNSWHAVCLLWHIVLRVGGFGMGDVNWHYGYGRREIGGHVIRK